MRPTAAVPGTAGDQSARAHLRAAGQRVTGPRLAVLTCMLRVGDRHVSADEIYELLAASHADVHRATVYRTLESLTRAGLLRHVHLERGLTAYHTALTDAGGPAADTHLHAQCSACGAVVDLPPTVLGDTAHRVLAASGFRLDASHVALSGTCSACGPHRHP